ncbi:MAG: hypothetical protein Q8K99_07700 [Actinomycetota bacterium]|nr:hypothetical protein [Actinomycetota bacterium]
MKSLRFGASTPRRDDDGFSVLEVVLAAFIMFFALTAVLGLVGTSTRMSLSAKQRTAMVNAVNSHFEWVRSLDFEKIASTSEGGDILPVKTITVDGFTVTITTTISEGTGNTKEVRVAAEAAAPGYRSVRMTSFAAIRNSEAIVVGTEDSPLEIDFGTRTPVANTIVYESYVMGGADLIIDADAETTEPDGVVSELEFSCLNQPLRSGSTLSSPVAAWTPGTPTVSQSFKWDTEQVKSVDGLTVAAIADGWRDVYIIARDNQGREERKSRRLYVDNKNPDLPGVPIAQVNNNSETRVSWAAAKDGTHDAWSYEVLLEQINGSGSLVSVGTTACPDPVYIHNGSTFSRYCVSVRALSPRNLASAYQPIATPYVTRPTLTGTSTCVYTGSNESRKSTTSVSLTSASPTFAASGVAYDVYRKNMNDATPAWVFVKTSDTSDFTDSVVKTVGANGVADPYLYKVQVRYSATVYAPLANQSIWSDEIGPTTVLEGTLAMGHVAW